MKCLQVSIVHNLTPFFDGETFIIKINVRRRNCLGHSTEGLLPIMSHWDIYDMLWRPAISLQASYVVWHRNDVRWICRSTAHQTGQCKVRYNDLHCCHCDRCGHIQQNCCSKPSTQVGTVEAADNNSSSDSSCNYIGEIAEVTPRLTVKISHPTRHFTFPSFPDTGSCASIISSSSLQHFIT